MNGYQIFVQSTDQPGVVAAIREYVKRVGSATRVSLDSEKPSLALARRSARTFIVSTPEHGHIAVWEDGSWADKRLAKELSSVLGARAIWIVVSSVTDSWGYVTFANGVEVDKHSESGKDVGKRAERFVKENDLPFALMFFEDPNAEDEYQKLLAKMKATRGPDSPFHQIDAGRTVRPARDASLKRFPEGATVPRALKNKVSRFAEIRIPVTRGGKEKPS